jgi:hypothetical protein
MVVEYVAGAIAGKIAEKVTEKATDKLADTIVGKATEKLVNTITETVAETVNEILPTDEGYEKAYEYIRTQDKTSYQALLEGGFNPCEEHYFNKMKVTPFAYAAELNLPELLEISVNHEIKEKFTNCDPSNVKIALKIAINHNNPENVHLLLQEGVPHPKGGSKYLIEGLDIPYNGNSEKILKELINRFKDEYLSNESNNYTKYAAIKANYAALSLLLQNGFSSIGVDQALREHNSNFYIAENCNTDKGETVYSNFKEGEITKYLCLIGATINHNEL